MFLCPAALEKKMAGRQGREELIKQGLLEMMEQGKGVPGRVADISGTQGIEGTHWSPRGLWDMGPMDWTGARGP